MFDHQTLLVTGGTGSFGNDFIRLVLDRHDPEQVIVFSRDEKKQHDMRLKFDGPRLAFVIGDIRDRNQIAMAMRGVNFVFHAAALKQVPSCEFFPMEAVQTNVIGTQNVLDAAELNGVDKLVVLSTDKAVYPINAMGQTKALMEKLTLARAQSSRTKVVFCGVRYGNVMYSRGSVIPLFVKQITSGAPLTVTAPEMTRLLLPLSEAVKLVGFAME
ncbi:MAG: polysaccharide biosynthesis protein, partial [Pirellulales bacterium]|nr:polysaccharide biosynthesis protein [Pirellulales bacterium]